MKAILTGTTGYVGEGVLLAMLDDRRIDKVLSIGRRPCGHSHAKLEELIVPDLMDIKEGDPRLEGYDVCFFAAGITSVGTPKDVYDRISFEIPTYFASIMPNKDQMTFIYVSGAGTTDKGKQHWQKVKSATENIILRMGFKHAFGWRPMLMLPYKGQTNKQLRAQKMAMVMYPVVRILKNYNSMTEMCRAIIRVTTEGYSKKYLNPSDIMKLAR
ncbi:MAG: hypothetical protein MJY72_05845 [Bacteroidales bacterium]|nr:hypothetical protein [Bacteroidales bacterium]